MKEIKKNQFSLLFNDVKKMYSKLNPINKQTLHKIDDKIYQDRINIASKEYVLSIIATTIFFLIFPIIIYKVFNSLDLLIHSLLNIINNFIDNNKTVTQISLLLSGCTLIIYTFVFPFKNKIFTDITSRFKNLDFAPPQKKYNLFIVFSIYLHNPVSSNTQSGFSRTPCLIEHS